LGAFLDIHAPVGILPKIVNKLQSHQR